MKTIVLNYGKILELHALAAIAEHGYYLAKSDETETAVECLAAAGLIRPSEKEEMLFPERHDEHCWSLTRDGELMLERLTNVLPD